MGGDFQEMARNLQNYRFLLKLCVSVRVEAVTSANCFQSGYEYSRATAYARITVDAWNPLGCVE